MPRSLEEIRAELYRAAREPESDLAQAAFWIAIEEYPNLDPAPYLDGLSRSAERVQSTLAGESSPEAWRHAMAVELFEHRGFRGNVEDYYDPRNSYLNDVIDRRVGIPITLAVLYLSIARRTGRTAVGLNTPGHFLVLAEGAIVDPFHRGRAVERSALLSQLARAGVERPAERLDGICRAPANTAAVLTRMLANLRAVHLRRGDIPRALAAVDRLVHLDPSNPAWLRDRGALFQRLDCARAAVADLEAYLARVPDDPEADVIREAVARLSRDLPPLQ